MRTIRILIADDHQMFLEGISALLKDILEIRIVALALNGRQVVKVLGNEKVDIVVSDISMPEMDGVELSKFVKKSYPDVKVLVLTTHKNAAMINKLMETDVDGYLLKNAEKNELIKALYTLADGEKYFSDEVKKEYMDIFFSRVQKSDNEPMLSRREKEILKNIAMEYTAQQIADKLFISPNTVNTHRKNLLSKLKVKNTAGLVKYAIQHGLCDE